MDFQEKFQEMIDAYNAGSMNIEAFFQELVDLAKGSWTGCPRTRTRQRSTRRSATPYIATYLRRMGGNGQSIYSTVA
jgi:hypothetical protein